MGAPLLVLPDGGTVTVAHAATKEGNNKILHNGAHILSYTLDADAELAFDAAAAGTRFHGTTTHVPAYPLLTLSAPSRAPLALADCWTAVYALFTLFYTQEHIPTALGAIDNAAEIREYLLTSGLGRVCPTPPTSTSVPTPTAPTTNTATDVLFLSRSMFWQAAGTTGFHTRQHWLLTPRPPLPPVASYTRSERVIAVHPQRPAKPAPGEVLYRRWCGALRETIDITYFDVDGVRDGDYASGDQGGGEGEGGERVSRHLAAFHRWHNDARVNAAWGERGALAAHRAYVEGLLADPHALPCMLSWNGELMGYVEVVYTKEDHVAMNYPAGVVPGEWERGIHVLVGEEKFLGNGRAEIWIRSLCHYIFLADPRTDRVAGEPSSDNVPIAKAGEASGFHTQTIFDFPYKRSRLILNPREKFFTLCRLW
ncbi:hypothetical protein HYPSUDRAFT_145083 [Hypholoma sublateritium FD-334 SS-4]|uniref:Acyltransferase MbtK/IucB-like conserved domain-containing protein n=1 Tax=Hypholoma sublateritium (strain FD-334 SS-4) TaxID=945553 RepID=A0A0D2NHA6_HYPSF|nr:hypothetical protein HYPSUDRAFT_145083 [Hypholoma sublateritium FD-334 SS-4]